MQFCRRVLLVALVFSSLGPKTHAEASSPCVQVNETAEFRAVVNLGTTTLDL